MKPDIIIGATLDTMYDDRYQCVNLELAKCNITDDDTIGYYEIHFSTTSFGSKKKKFKTILKLHIDEAIRLKSIIDQLVYHAHEDRIDRVNNK